MDIHHVDGTAVLLLLLGLVPLVGLVLLGRWPSWETGLATVVVIFALRELLGPA
jgi:hypothetical protein